ncbi:MAG TPA: hypothetical protein PLQ36_00640 [Candidatus Gracilibacteria bacterium]|nr:hypothetical protein [Candidatus Gracilibacteria bacterium]
MINNAQKIIAHLLTKTSVTNLLGDRIFLGAPKDVPINNYLVLNVISDNIDNVTEKRGRIEFRFIGGNENITYNSLNEAYLAVMAEMKVRDIGDFKPHKIITSQFFMDFDANKRRFILQDLIFHYTY